MLDPISVALKFGFLLVLYLFLLWIVRSALRDLRRGNVVAADEEAAAPPPDATGFHQASAGLGGVVDSGPRAAVGPAPGHEPGMEYDVGDGATMGRGNVEIK